MTTQPTKLNSGSRTAWSALFIWNPKPIPEPVFDPSVLNRCALERASTILAYSLLKLEFAISDQGLLREWSRLCLRLCLALSLPALLIMPAVVVMTNGILEFTTAVSLIFSNLLEIIITIVVSAIIIATVIAIVFQIIKTRNPRKSSYEN